MILLQAAGGSGVTFQMLLLGGMILVFWLFMIRPQAKKAKAAKEFQSNLQKGYKVVTIAGIHAEIPAMPLTCRIGEVGIALENNPAGPAKT